MPVTWGLDDFPAFEYVSLPHKLYPGLRTPDDVFPIWMGDFDYMCQQVSGGVFILTMHPQVIGRGHRMLFLDRLLKHMLETGANFVRMVDYVEKWKKAEI